VDVEECGRNQSEKVRRKLMNMSQSDDVKSAVLNALHWDLAVPPHRVKVEVENGWVTMSGMVDRPYQLGCAESDARRVPGVAGVTNQIRLASARVEQGSVSY
jgi:osmotically-inducible protein OsmY